ncbi:MAG: hypothetical protein K2Q13_03915 [Nitrosomonas sp.]|uniref:hypothetical protein n=1 Tax=Nitrosomonas sp. TaxID=42353 RepID=UPI0025E13CC7|nr:hypothetical protein [Nitrosomonas sp.]MBY0474193.1 hypothetical protein [Nitrosomonas sp.]
MNNNSPGIIVYHYEDKLMLEEVEALQNFYQPGRLVFEHDLNVPLPNNTLAVMKLEDGPFTPHRQDASIQFISINAAFVEIQEHILRTMRRDHPQQDPYHDRLEKFIAEKKGDIFSLNEVLLELGIEEQTDGAMYAAPSIIKALCELGCSKENVMFFTPPAPKQDAQQQKRIRVVEPFEIAS